MITVTQLNGQDVLVNPELIERVEGGPETVIVMANGHRYVVSTTPEEIRERVVSYRAEVLRKARAAARGRGG